MMSRSAPRPMNLLELNDDTLQLIVRSCARPLLLGWDGVDPKKKASKVYITGFADAATTIAAVTATCKELREQVNPRVWAIVARQVPRKQAFWNSPTRMQRGALSGG